MGVLSSKGYSEVSHMTTVDLRISPCTEMLAAQPTIRSQAFVVVVVTSRGPAEERTASVFSRDGGGSSKYTKRVKYYELQTWSSTLQEYEEGCSVRGW